VVVALGTTSESSVAPLRELLPSSAELIVKTGVLPREYGNGFVGVTCSGDRLMRS